VRARRRWGGGNEKGGVREGEGGDGGTRIWRRGRGERKKGRGGGRM